MNQAKQYKRFLLGLVLLLNIFAEAGARLILTDLLGLRLQAVLNVPLQGLGSSFFVGRGSNGVSVNSYSSIVQVSLSGGFIFHFVL